MATYLEAAKQILERAQGPLHYREVTRLALEQGLIKPDGASPEATMGSRLYVDAKCEDPVVCRTDEKGVFDLLSRQPRGIEAEVQEINKATRKELRKRLSLMEAPHFETLIYELLVQMGFDESHVTRKSIGGTDGR